MSEQPKQRAIQAVRGILAQRPAPPPLDAPSAARLVRPIQCPKCGGHKRTEPRTAYVYCDFCGALFDYDIAIARSAGGNTSSQSDGALFEVLIDAVRPEIRRAFAAKDDDAYRIAWRWPYETDMTLCPTGWSPRINDPAYRSAMVDFCVETCVVHNRNEKRRQALGPARTAYAAVSSAPSTKTFKKWSGAIRRVLELEAEAFRAGAFALHPDQLDDATYLRLNIALQVLDWRTSLTPEQFDELLAVAGIVTKHAEAAPADLGKASCGHCGGKLLVVDGGRAVVCEACGHTLDRSSSFPCTSCGAHVLAPPGAARAKCAWCDALVQVVG